MPEVCEECGFDYGALAIADAPAALRRFSTRYRAPLTRFLPGEDGPTVLRTHPNEGVWSALEYACHVRDVFELQRQRLELALVEDTPTFEPMGRDERVTRDRYNEQDPADVLADLTANGEALAALVEELDSEQLDRTGIYSYPETAERTLAWVAIHTVHEAEHHLLDVGRVLRAARGR